MTDDEFLAAFEAAAIPRAEWTHEAHIRMAWLHLTRFPTDEACERIRVGIQKLNAINGVVDGYHETITIAFMRMIAARLLLPESYGSFLARNPELYGRSLVAILQYYTRERLFSSEARVQFVEPDVQMLPELGRARNSVG